MPGKLKLIFLTLYIGSPLRCAVSSANAATSSLPKSLSSPKSSTANIPEDKEDLCLVGDLATAQVGKVKRFSIDAPEGRRNSDCNVIISG